MGKEKNNKASVTGKKMLALILSALMLGTTASPAFAAAQDDAVAEAGYVSVEEKETAAEEAVISEETAVSDETAVADETAVSDEAPAETVAAENAGEEETPAPPAEETESMPLEADIVMADSNEEILEEGQALALSDSAQSATIRTCENGVPVLDITLNGTSLDAIKKGGKSTKYNGNSVTYTPLNGKATWLSDVTLKGRGNSTWGAAKKPYQIKFAKKQDLFGQGKAKTWILLANYFDYSHMRNDATFNLASKNGVPGALPVGMFVEVYFDGVYEGLYYLTRKVEAGTVPLKDDNGMIAEVEEIHAPDDLYKDSKAGTRIMIKETVIDSDVEAEQQAVLDRFMNAYNAFEQAVIKKDYRTAAKYADMESFAKYFLISDFTGGQDMFGSSCYMYKDGDNDLIHAGPMWDFDLGYACFTVPVAKEGTNPFRTWAYLDTRETPGSKEGKKWCDLYEWLMNMPEFRELVRKTYWNTVRETFMGIDEYTENKASAIDAAIRRDIKKWHPAASVSAERKKVLDYMRSRAAYFDILYGERITENGYYTMNGAYKNEAVKAERTNDGFFVIRNAKGQVLDVCGGGKGNGTTARWYDTYNGTDAQKWLILTNGAVVAKETGLLLTQASNGAYTIRYASIKDGVQSTAQTFRFEKTRSQITDSENKIPEIVTKEQSTSAPVPKAYGASLKEGVDYTVESRIEGDKVTYAYTGIGDFTGTGSASTVIARDPGLDSGFYYKVTSVLNSGKAMTVRDGSLVNSGNVQLETFSGVLEDYWKFDKQDDGTYVITNARSGLALDIAGGRMANSANVQQYKANGTKAQRFIVDRHSDGTCTFYNANSLKAVDVSGGCITDGTNVQQYTYNGTRAQRWYIGAKGKVADMSGQYVLVSQTGRKDKAVSVKSTSYADGANVLMWDAATSQSRKWTLTENGDAAGSYTIKSAYSGKALDISGGSKRAGANVQQYASNGTNAQKWVIVESMDGGTYTIYSICSGLALDIQGGSTANRANVQVYWPNGTAAQMWGLKAA